MSSDETQPPGTFRLIREDGSGDFGHHRVVMLDPVPTKDPNEPLNWSTARKAVNFGLIMAVTALVFTALSIQIIFWQQMTVDLRLTYQQLVNSICVNFVGLAMGCLLFIPLAKKFGRRPIYLVSTAVMAGMSFWTAKITGLGGLYATNLLYGLAGATNEAITQITIADLFFVHHRGSMNGLYLAMVMVGSFLTPMASGAQATAQGWRFCYITLGICTTIVFVLFLFFYEETKYAPSINGITTLTPVTTVEEPISKDGKGTSAAPIVETSSSEYEQPTALHHELDHSIPMRPLKERLAFWTYTPEPIWQSFYRPLVVLFTFPTALFTGLQYASGVVWLTIMATVLGLVMPLPPYSFTPAQIGYMSGGPFIGNLLGSFYGGFLADRAILYYSRRNGGLFEPEMRLYILHLPALAMAGGILMFGITLAKGEHWILPSIGGAMFGFGLGSIGDASLTLVIDSYKEITGDAFTGIAFLRNAISIGIPFAITPWIERDGLQTMFIVCGFLSLAVSAFIIPMIMYGKRIRAAWAPRYRKYAARGPGSHL